MDIRFGNLNGNGSEFAKRFGHFVPLLTFASTDSRIFVGL